MKLPLSEDFSTKDLNNRECSTAPYLDFSFSTTNWHKCAPRSRWNDWECREDWEDWEDWECWVDWEDWEDWECWECWEVWICWEDWE